MKTVVTCFLVREGASMQAKNKDGVTALESLTLASKEKIATFVAKSSR